MELIKTTKTFLEGVASYNLASPETIQPFLPDFKKATIQAEATNIVQRVKDGEISALQAHLMAKALVKMADIIVDQTKAETITEAATYGKHEAEIFGASFQIANTPDTYDFESDQEYKELSDALKKRRELLTQALKTIAIMADINGVEIPKVPVKTYGGETIKVTFK